MNLLNFATICLQKDLESFESQQVKELLTNQEKYFVDLINYKKEIQTLNQIVASKVLILKFIFMNVCCQLIPLNCLSFVFFIIYNFQLLLQLRIWNFSDHREKQPSERFIKNETATEGGPTRSETETEWNWRPKVRTAQNQFEVKMNSNKNYASFSSHYKQIDTNRDFIKWSIFHLTIK